MRPPGDILIQALLWVIPELVALIVALVLVITGRHRKPAAFFMIAIGILVFLRFLWPFYLDWLWVHQNNFDWSPTRERITRLSGTILSQVFQAGALALLLIAAIGWRSPAGAAQSPAPAPAPGPGARHAGTLAHVRPISKGLFLGSILGAFALGLLLLIPAQALIYLDRGRNAAAGLGFACGAEILTLFGAVMLAILIYKLWAAIQGEPTTRTTPGKAIGFLFIPFFNLYGVFQASWGWARDYNAFVDARGIAAPRAPAGLALTLCIFILIGMVMALIPFVGLVFSLVSFILLAVFLTSATTGVNAIAAAGAATPAPSG